jgi:flagellar biosynthesis activator protein FlaF
VYQIRYADIQSDSLADARERERIVLDRSIGLLTKAEAEGGESFAAVEALHYAVRLWTALLDDLSRHDNMLPDEQKASLISIGIWMLREADDIRNDPSKSFEGMIDISKIIRGGLDEKHV